MDRLAKFLASLDAKRRSKVERTIEAILAGQLDGLDIKPLKGLAGRYRCRIGDMRILFYKTQEGYFAYNADFRGNIYKK